MLSRVALVPPSPVPDLPRDPTHRLLLSPALTSELLLNARPPTASEPSRLLFPCWDVFPWISAGLAPQEACTMDSLPTCRTP